MIILTNSFHQTEVRLKAAVGDTVPEEVVTWARRQLCRPSCSCSGADGTRNSAYGIVKLGEAWVVIKEEMGSARLAASEFGRWGGSVRNERTHLKGSGSLPPEQRSAKAKAAALARWDKVRAAKEQQKSDTIKSSRT